MKKSLLTFCGLFTLSMFASTVVQAFPVHFDLERQEPKKDGSIHGKLTGGHNCETLENNKNNEKNNRPYAIPPGTYKVEVTHSPKFNRPMPIVQNVPGRDGIRFHSVTKSDQTTGCIGLPSRSDENAVKKAILDDKAKGIPSDITIRAKGDPKKK
ncbi:hypothetical protein AGMMS49593_02200 [Endomicrobiia bacterium]|nr:hypothetical protein AGMMS49593_02200 [Endomicrobiia bacterium]